MLVTAVVGVEAKNFYTEQKYLPIRSNPVDFVYTDKPFNVQKDKKGNIIDEDKIDESSKCVEYARYWFNILADTGHVAVRCADGQVGYWQRALKVAGFNVTPRTLVMVRDPAQVTHRRDNFDKRVNAHV